MLGGTFNTSTGFTSTYRDNFFFGDVVSGNVMRVTLDASSNVTSITPFATSINQYIDAAFGPDGAYYYVQNNGQVRRTTFNHSARV